MGTYILIDLKSLKENTHFSDLTLFLSNKEIGHKLRHHLNTSKRTMKRE